MSKLERTTHICLIVVSIVAMGLLLELRSGEKRTAAPPSATQLVGKRLTVTGLDWKSSAVHLVLFVSTHCRICDESMPFYRQITAVPGPRPQGAAISAISYDAPELVMERFSKEHVTVDGVYRVSTIDGLSSTPTLLFVDRSGTVRRVFVGKLDSSGEQDVLKIFVAGMYGKLKV